MTTLIFLIGMALTVAGFAILTHLLSRTHSREEKRYLLRQRRDDLVYLAVQGKITPSDPLFTELFPLLESFEDICNDLSIIHLIEGRRRVKPESLNVQRVKEFIQRIENSDKDVREVAESSLRDMARIVIQNSITIKFLFYVLKIAIQQYLPSWLKKQIKRFVGPFWEAAKGIALIDDNIGLQPAKR